MVSACLDVVGQLVALLAQPGNDQLAVQDVHLAADRLDIDFLAWFQARLTGHRRDSPALLDRRRIDKSLFASGQGNISPSVRPSTIRSLILPTAFSEGNQSPSRQPVIASTPINDAITGGPTALVRVDDGRRGDRDPAPRRKASSRPTYDSGWCPLFEPGSGM